MYAGLAILMHLYSALDMAPSIGNINMSYVPNTILQELLL